MGMLRQYSKPIYAFLFLALCIFSAIPLRGDTQSDYFSDPKLFSTEELAQELKKKTLNMCWHFGQASNFCFISGNDEVSFQMQLGALPALYDDFVARVKDKFIKNETEKKLVFSYQMKNDENEEFHLPPCSPYPEDPDTYDYLVADRRVIENANPRRMTQDELVSIIRDRNVLFYTGAGLSRASAVPAMDELNELLGFDEKNFLFSLESALENPKAFATKIQEFHQACLFSPPTPAHLALRDLAVFKNIRILTENLDSLHEASGIYPYRIDPHHLREIGGSSLAPFDYIICVGLSYDDRGFLGWYKQQNPQGKIIAIDLNQPSYLGNEDFLVIADIQEIIPALQNEIVP